MTNSSPLNVSRETTERLEVYSELLRKWNRRINLVARSTLVDLWARHIVDSAQAFQLAPHPVDHWVDLGSGAGFPGLVVAIMAREAGSPARVTLVESDARKCAFLRTVIRDTGVTAIVLNKRIENVAPLAADVLSARALADLATLLGFAERHLAPSGTALFHKGASWKKELAEAQDKWKFDQRVAKSETEEGSVILSIAGVARV